MNGQIDYREMAEIRVYNDPILKRIQVFLKWMKNLKMDWGRFDYFWQWLATASTDNIRENEEYLEPHFLRTVAHHEAGHAVASIIAEEPFKQVTIVPDYPNNRFAEVEMLRDDINPDFHFHIWRMIFSTLAGPEAENKYTGKDPVGDKMDNFNVGLILGQLYPSAERDLWRKTTREAAEKLVGSPILWRSIKKVADELLKQGSLQPSQVSEIVKAELGDLNNYPVMVIGFQRMYEVCAQGISSDTCSNMISRANAIFERELFRLFMRKGDM